MRVLIVEDNEFNAFCLRRLLESVVANGSITIENNSNAALTSFYAQPYDLVIIDGDLGAISDRSAYCQGPELAQILLHKYPYLPIIAWTDSKPIRQEFRELFKQYDRLNEELIFWSKMVSMETICKTWTHYFAEFIVGRGGYHRQSSALSSLA